MSIIGRWLLAIRPKTLGISVAPVLVGSSLAYAELGRLQWLTATAALIVALFIQIGTNLYNDAADHERGADGPERIGPARATAQGWFTSAQVKSASHLCFGLAFLLGIYLASVGGWPIVVVGLLSLASGYAYTGGPKPIAYSASGELFVFVFFGLVAVMGSYYLQTLQLSLNSFYCACALGLLAAAVLLVNNYRDLETDTKAHKLTLTHYLGTKRSHIIYGLFLLLPFLLPLLLSSVGGWIWLILILTPAALLLLRSFIQEKPGPIFNRYLANTARLQLAYSALLSVGLYLG
jgi:1,4-dihydroxy-2-naphthoate polyprenyltransferase